MIWRTPALICLNLEELAQTIRAKATSCSVEDVPCGACSSCGKPLGCFVIPMFDPTVND